MTREDRDSAVMADCLLRFMALARIEDSIVIQKTINYLVAQQKTADSKEEETLYSAAIDLLFLELTPVMGGNLVVGEVK